MTDQKNMELELLRGELEAAQRRSAALARENVALRGPRPSRVCCQRLVGHAMLPTRAHAGDAGLDLYATEAVDIEPWHSATIHTGVAMEIPPGWEGELRGRSGMARAGVLVHPGTIDSSYRGEICAVLHNIGHGTWHVHVGDRVAQVVISPVLLASVEEADELSPSERGERGWGSTGA